LTIFPSEEELDILVNWVRDDSDPSRSHSLAAARVLTALLKKEEYVFFFYPMLLL
jgi:hypothetical protein